MAQVLVISDANVLIDMEAGGLLRPMFRLDCHFCAQIQAAPESSNVQSRGGIRRATQIAQGADTVFIRTTVNGSPPADGEKLESRTGIGFHGVLFAKLHEETGLRPRNFAAPCAGLAETIDRIRVSPAGDTLFLRKTTP